MTSGETLRQAACVLALGACWLVVPGAAATVLRSADVRIAASSPAVCDVSMTLTVDGGGAIDHRLEVLDGTEVANLLVQGARQMGEPQSVGRTRSLVLTPEHGSYTVSYRVRQAAARSHRCPLWVPTAAADGVSRAVQIRVTLPLGTEPGSSMPRFTWNGPEGTVTLGHLPAFVLVPYRAPGTPAGWNVAAAMDAAAVAVFVAASALWLWRRKVGSGGSGG